MDGIITIEVEQGLVEVGILDQNSFWLTPPQTYVKSIHFFTKQNKYITIVIANNQYQEPYLQTKFTVSKPQLFLILQRDSLYVDRLTSRYESDLKKK